MPVDSCQGSDEVTIKKGRGRPKKLTNENVNEDVADKESKVDEEVVVVNDVPVENKSEEVALDDDEVMLSQRKSNLRRSRRVSQTNDPNPDQVTILDPIEKPGDTKEVAETPNVDINGPSEILPAPPLSESTDKFETLQNEEEIIKPKKQLKLLLPRI